MKTYLFKFSITDFEEVYVIIDNENQRLHISPANYSYNITLNLQKDLNDQIEKYTRNGDVYFNSRVRKVSRRIIEELKLVVA